MTPLPKATRLEALKAAWDRSVATNVSVFVQLSPAGEWTLSTNPVTTAEAPGYAEFTEVRPSGAMRAYAPRPGDGAYYVDSEIRVLLSTIRDASGPVAGRVLCRTHRLAPGEVLDLVSAGFLREIPGDDHLSLMDARYVLSPRGLQAAEWGRYDLPADVDSSQSAREATP